MPGGMSGWQQKHGPGAAVAAAPKRSLSISSRNGNHLSRNCERKTENQLDRLCVRRTNGKG